jgi:hypothetical protein
MKKILLVVIFYLAGVTGVFAQAGYRNFTFGMSPNQVKQLAPDSTEYQARGGSSTPYIFMYLYNSEVGSSFAVISQYFDEFPTGIKDSWLYSKQEDLLFFFVDNKLHQVCWQDTGNILADLQKRYGDKRVITAGSTETVTWIDGKRIILYAKFHDGSEAQFIGYYDAEYYNPIIQNALQKYRNSRRSRID